MQDSRITIAANVIRYLSEYIHGLNAGRNNEKNDLALLNASDQFGNLRAIDSLSLLGEEKEVKNEILEEVVNVIWNLGEENSFTKCKNYLSEHYTITRK